MKITRNYSRAAFIYSLYEDDVEEVQTDITEVRGEEVQLPTVTEVKGNEIALHQSVTGVNEEEGEEDDELPAPLTNYFRVPTDHFVEDYKPLGLEKRMLTIVTLVESYQNDEDDLEEFSLDDLDGGVAWNSFTTKIKSEALDFVVTTNPAPENVFKIDPEVKNVTLQPWSEPILKSQPSDDENDCVLMYDAKYAVKREVPSDEEEQEVEIIMEEMGPSNLNYTSFVDGRPRCPTNFIGNLGTYEPLVEKSPITDIRPPPNYEGNFTVVKGRPPQKRFFD